MRTAVFLAMFAAVTVLGRPVSVAAQNTTITISGFPVSFPTLTGSHFNAGFVDGNGPTTFTVDAAAGGLFFNPRVARVDIRSNAATPVGGSKPLSTLKWRRADSGTWTTLTTNNVTVEQRTMTVNGANDPWSNQIFWRFDLNWLNDPPSAASTFHVIFTLTISSP